MGSWQIFAYWLIPFFGFLWLKRLTGLLRCNIFSAAIASAVFSAIMTIFSTLAPYVLEAFERIAEAISLGIATIFGTLSPYVLEVWNTILILYFFFMGLLVVPVTFYFTLRLGSQSIPFFKVDPADLQFCTVWLWIWAFVGELLFSLIEYTAFIILTGATEFLRTL